MRFSVLALDYDGTIARDGWLDPAIALAICDARARGIVVVLATGRTLADLRRVLPDTTLFDAIVAENGAVLAFANGQTRILARQASRELMDELCRHEISFSAGECLLDADAADAPVILAAVRRLELPLMLVFNRNRVMILPQSVNKASGLREALDAMRLSLHNCISIGDAENDHALLDASEVGVAVAWGSKSLQNIADHVLPGAGPEAVAEYIREVASHCKLPPHRAGSRRLLLGETSEGRFDTAIHGRNILIAGDPRSGKSWITGLVCEQLILQGYCLCVIDPEGDYSTLESLPGVQVFGGDEPPPSLNDVARALRHPNTSVVIDLSADTQEEKLRYVGELLPMLAALRRRSGLPHWIVVDEAQYFLGEADAENRLDLELAAYLLITYRPSYLHHSLLDAVETILVTPLTNPDEVRALNVLCGAQDREAEWAELLGSLGIDEASWLPRRSNEARLPRRFTIAQRVTSHVRHRSKYLEVPMPEERAFHFTCNGQSISVPARTLKEFAEMQERVPLLALEGHAERGDFSRWIAKVFGDQPLADEIARVEARFRKGRIRNLARAITRAIRGRYEVSPSR